MTAADDEEHSHGSWAFGAASMEPREQVFDFDSAYPASSPEAQDAYLAVGVDPLLLQLRSNGVTEWQASLHAPPPSAQILDPHPSNTSPARGASAPAEDSRKRLRDEVDDAADEPVGSLKKARQETREETSLWTTVKKFLQSPESLPEPAVSCPICYGEIAIRGLPSQAPCPWKLSGGWQKVGSALPCAHVVCQECIERHLGAQEEASREPTCPVCRLDLKHGYCGHAVAAKRLPLASSETADMVPLTLPELPEDRRALPEDCLPCLREAASRYLDVSLNHIVNLVQGTDDSTEKNVADNPLWAHVAGHLHSVVRNFTNDSKMRTPHWEFLGMSDQGLKVAFIDDACVATLAPDIRYSGQDTIIWEDDHQAYWLVPQTRASRSG